MIVAGELMDFKDVVVVFKYAAIGAGSSAVFFVRGIYRLFIVVQQLEESDETAWYKVKKKTDLLLGEDDSGVDFNLSY